MPSFYGLLTFPFFYFLYCINVFQYEEKNFEAQVIFLSVIFFFGASILFNFSNYRRLINNNYLEKKKTFNRLPVITYLLLILFFVIGLFGVIKYVLDFSGYFGGIWLFFFLLVNDSAQIRIATDMQSSIGFQLTYFAWFAATFLFVDVKLKNLKGKYIFLSVLTFILNLLFIDRTRPLTILFTTLLMLFFMFFDTFKRKTLIRIFLITGISLVSIFIIIGEWVGKVAQEGQYGKTFLPPVFQTAALYGTSSFGYFNRIVEVENAGNFNPERSLYPLQKILSSFHIVKVPPPQIIEFYFIPQPVNVGTFLEPLYRDGGIFFCFLGILLHTFLFDFLGLYFIKNANRFTLYTLSILCFINFFAFFSPKFNSTPVWFFLVMGLISVLYERIKYDLFK